MTFHYDNADDVHLMGASESSGGKQRPKISIENLFIECYQLDENETPARYKLKHLDRLLPGFDDKVNKSIIISIYTKSETIEANKGTINIVIFKEPSLS